MFLLSFLVWAVALINVIYVILFHNQMDKDRVVNEKKLKQVQALVATCLTNE